MENGEFGADNEKVTEVEEPEILTLDTVVGDSFFTEIKSKINNKSGLIKRDLIFDKFEINKNVSEFRSLLQKQIIEDSENL